MIDNKTERLKLPLPDADNFLDYDVVRIKDALSILDMAATVDDNGKIHTEQLPPTTLNSNLLSEAFKKISNGTATIVCVGDSITYGHDTISPGTVPPISPHVVPRVQTPYPEQMGINLNAAFGTSGTTIINRGFSGDTVKMSYSRWTQNPLAHLAIVMFGINDALVGGVGLSVDEYTKYLRLTIERYLGWGSAVAVSLSSLMSRGDEPREVYKFRAAAISVAEEYGCPVFAGYEVGAQHTTADIYSDSVHFNQAGYSLFGSNVASFILGGGLLRDKISVSSNSTFPVGYLARIATDGNITSGTGSFVASGLILELVKGSGDSATYSFYLDGDAAEVYAIGQISNGCEVKFDFGAIAARATKKAINANTLPSYTVSSNQVRNSGNTDVFLGRVVGKGWHSVSLSAPPSAAAYSTYINAFTSKQVQQIECEADVWPVSPRSFSIFDPKPTLAALPPSSTANVFTVPGYLFGSLLWRGSGYFVSTFATIEIRNLANGYQSYTRAMLSLNMVSGAVVFDVRTIDSVGDYPVTIQSVTGDPKEGLATSGDLTFTLNRPVAGFVEMRFHVVDSPDIRFAGMV